MEEKENSLKSPWFLFTKSGNIRDDLHGSKKACNKTRSLHAGKIKILWGKDVLFLTETNLHCRFGD